MNKLSKYPLFLLFTALASCSSDNDALPTSHPVAPPSGDALALTVSARDFVTDGAPGTRATDNGPVTTFENDDRIGVIILDAGDTPLYNNIPYKYVSSSQTWVFDSNNGEGKEICYYDSKARTYIVYYPYNKDADNCKGENDLKAIFKPKTDQSAKDAYRASDLMAYTTTSGTPLKSLEATLTHAYASVSLSPIAQYILDDGAEPKTTCTPPSLKISDVNLTVGNDVYVPYLAADGSLRCILPVGTPGDVRCFYTIGGKTYNHTISISDAVANTRYTSAPKIINEPYSLDHARAGDFYCKKEDGNGYLIPGDVASLTSEQQAACIGIVYTTEVKRIGTAAEEALKEKGVRPHGLVMALTNASDGCQWGNYGTDENNGGNDREPFKDNTDQLAKQYNNVDGYAETQWIINAYKNNGTTLKDTYSAFYYANRYGTAEGNTGQYAAPDNTTGWFIPSMGQWWDILSGLGEINLDSYKTVTNANYANISGASTTAINNMNTYLQKISGATQFGQGTFFWSSSEYSGNLACSVDFPSNGYLGLGTSFKYNSLAKVRCSFAF